MDTAPEDYGPEFLAWLKERTERAWKRSRRWSMANLRRTERLGGEWRRGTHWTGGLSDGQVAEVQDRFGVRFAPQQRLFLQTLHSTTPWQRGMHYEGNQLTTYDSPGFYDWTTDEEHIRWAQEWPLEGLIASSPEHQYWHRSWGPCPKTIEGRRERVVELAATAPPLIPIFGHRYIVAGEFEQVLSIHGTDIIVYGVDLRDYLLNELKDVLGIEYARPYAERPDIPFWQDIIDMD
ncbi:MAG TPA: hypothetical protein VHC49_13200 [Mycobacteriales bacterium]|nr:hypothetical protein [Mycobacteriales bacterium]